jgi:uridine phosphorylase
MSKDLFYEMREGSFYNHEQDTSTYWEKDNMICRLEHESENVQFIYKLDKADKLRILRDMIEKRNEYIEDRKSSRDYKITLFVLISLIVFLLVVTLTLKF